MSRDKYSSGDGYMYVYLLSIVACVVVALVVALMVFGSGLFKKPNPSGPADNNVSAVTPSQPDNELSGFLGDESEPSRFTLASVDNSEVNNGLLILVNSDNRYAFPAETDMVNLYASLKDSNVSFSGSGLYLNSTATKSLKAMCEAFYSESGLNSGILVHDAYLSYEKALEKEGSDAAGASDYHIGNSVRLMAWPSKVGTIGEGTFSWFLDNCYSYGFILRYPEGKDAVTGHAAHKGIYRYVGVCHAYYMYKNNLCLEEYLELLKQYTPEEPLIIDVQNKSYEVYYQPMEDGLTSGINVPNDSAYLISGNNYDGFIITVTG